MDDSITVVIPTCDRAHVLPRALDSVLRQSRPAQEIIVVDDDLKQLIRGECGADEIRRAAEANGTVPLMRDAARRVSRGDTTMDEVYRSVA